MDITLKRLTASDKDALHKFECENRTYFEASVPSRGDNYYDLEEFNKRHEALLTEQSEGNSRFYLIKNKANVIVGRINLVDIDETAKSAHIGFRVGEAYIGNGVAKNALAMLLALEKDIQTVYGKTSTDNIGSQKVMISSGFTPYEANEETMTFNGKTLTFVHYVYQRD